MRPEVRGNSAHWTGRIRRPGIYRHERATPKVLWPGWTPGAERKARNELLFRDLNEQVEFVAAPLDSGEGATFEFFCECSDVDCTLRLPMPLSEYERVRSDPTLFVVAPGHESPEIEEVVRREDGYQVVRKEGEAARLAVAQDPRS